MNEANRKPITILGAFFVDLACRTSRMPAWGETMHGESFALGPGGKGSNQAVAAARQGAATEFITRLGRDAFGEMGRRMFQSEGIGDRAVVTDDDLPTGAATILVDAKRGENAIIINPGACNRLGIADVEAAAEIIASSSFFVSQLELPLESCLHGIRLAHRSAVPVVLNPAPALPLPRDVFPLISYLTPNETEAAALTGKTIGTAAEVQLAARMLRDLGARNIVITLGEQGAFVSGEGFEGLVPPFNAGPLVDTTGAGDAFNGGFVAALAEGRELREATRFGCAVAGLSVTRAGTAPSMPGRAEVDTLLRNNR